MGMVGEKGNTSEKGMKGIKGMKVSVAEGDYMVLTVFGEVMKRIGSC